MSDLFKDIIPSILLTGQDILESERDYNPFLVNKALSFHYDCILYGQEMNLIPSLDKTLQYKFLLNSIRKYKRPWQPWLKREKLEELEVVKTYFDVSYEKAKEILPLLPPERMEKIRASLSKGGRSP